MSPRFRMAVCVGLCIFACSARPVQAQSGDREGRRSTGPAKAESASSGTSYITYTWTLALGALSVVPVLIMFFAALHAFRSHTAVDSSPGSVRRQKPVRPARRPHRVRTETPVIQATTDLYDISGRSGTVPGGRSRRWNYKRYGNTGHAYPVSAVHREMTRRRAEQKEPPVRGSRRHWKYGTN